ncbi:MAG TPA: MBL fold metallo-hydrolase [Acidimicrobiia bacterium]|nr:MBL fold metallo-hydrolase [Acidimicrobiia bacterium]
MSERWTEIAPSVFVRRHRSLDLNIGAVVCEDGVVIIDTRASHVQAAEMVESLRSITKLPVRWVINTHHHWDHTFGNQVFPDAALWGHERCAAAMRTQGEAMRARVKELAPDHAATLDAVVITPPTLTFTTTATVTFGGTTVEMRYLGRGHTDNDIVISLPERGVLFAGDLIEQGAPPSFNDSYPLEWPATVEALLALAGGVVVPGHGATVDAGFVTGQLDELQIVARLARERYADGLDAVAAAEMSGPYTPDVLATAFIRAWAQLGAS